MQAVILAGGKGTRLLPYTTVFPKPMLPVGGKPIIEIIVQQLGYYGFSDVVISLGYLGDYIRMYFQDPSRIPPGVTIRYVEESEPLGTAGPIALVPDLDEQFLVINGDILTTLDYRDFMRYHRERGAALTLAVGVKNVTMSLGILELDDEMHITNFSEKPTFTYHDNMGIYIYSRGVIDSIVKHQHLDLNELVLNLLARRERVCGYICRDPYFWIDIGRSGEYEEANREFEVRRKDFLMGEESRAAPDSEGA